MEIQKIVEDEMSKTTSNIMTVDGETKIEESTKANNKNHDTTKVVSAHNKNSECKGE